MNIVFGAASVPASAETESEMLCAVAETFAQKPRLLVFESEPTCQMLGILSDGGAVVGSARSDSAFLAYIGAITAPLEGWPHSNAPIDDPDATARFLLERYERIGEGFATGVSGQYAIAIHDKRNQLTILITDPSGGRSWFVYQVEGSLKFSSHLSSLAKSVGPDLSTDRTFEDFFLIYGFYPFGRTPYKNIQSLQPATFLKWRAGHCEIASLPATYPWAQDVAEYDEALAEEDLVDRLYEAMTRAMREQLPTKSQRVAVLLGGFDSALVAALIKRLGYDVETYSFRYQDQTYNQPYAHLLAQFLSIRHHWVDIENSVIAEGLCRYTETFNQPTNWPNYVIQTAYVCKRIRADGIRHCYSGDGCDAIFLGYPGTFLRARIFRLLPTPPRWLARGIVRLAERPWLDRWLGHPYRVAMTILRGLSRPKLGRSYLSFRIFDEISLKQLRKGEQPLTEKSIDELVKELSAPFSGLSELRLAYQGKSAVSPNRNKMIGSADHAGVTILAPYLHAGLRRFAMDLPDRLMRPQETTRSRVTGKYILMKMAEVKRLLPLEIIYQKKIAAVDAPVDAWYAYSLRETMLAMMKGLPFDYDETYINRLLDIKSGESLYKRLVMTDKVISHAPSLLATYAAFTRIVGKG